MPEAVQVGVFIHIIAVFGLGGASAISVAVFTMMQRAKTVQELRVWGSLGALLSNYYVFPALGLVLLLSGAYLVDKVGEEWSEGWIGLSSLALIVAVIVGYVVNTPRLKAIGMAAGPAPDGPVPASITEKLNEPVLVAVSRALPLTAVAIVWNMTTQPGTAGALLAIVVLAGIGAASAYLPAQQRT